MKSTLKLSVYIFMAGVSLFIFGGTNILFQAETTDIASISSFFKIGSIIGIAMIILSLIMFILVSAFSGPDK